MSQNDELREAFAFFDKDHDGFIASSELANILRAVGLYPTEADIARIVKSASSRVNFNEFVRHANSVSSDDRINENQMREAFKMFDQYGNGFVNLVQMRTSLQSLGERLRDDEIDELIREADIDAEGNVSYEELEGFIFGEKQLQHVQIHNW